MNRNPKQEWIIWWALWVAFLEGILVIYYFLSRSASAEGGSSEAPLWVLGYVPALVSVVIRWWVLPRLRTAQTALVCFLLGISMAEASCFLGIFLFPAQKQALFWVSVVGILQFAPYYAGRYINPRSGDDR
ncbi:MAG: hypothetical protein D6766_08150 [Verrucomicrobia bacterium]|nr:MAG: hypothetical protein D6766_08150 [Verrucomicrobiota bacterium]